MSADVATIEESYGKTRGAEAVDRWREVAFHCRDLASRGQSEAAQNKFAELNQEIGRFLAGWPKPPGEFEVVVSGLQRLLDDVSSWRNHPGVDHLGWTWTFHHASLTG